MSYNKITIIGFVGNDPDVFRFENGSMVVNFSVATSERGYTLQNGTNVPERTDWHSVKCTGKTAEFVEKWIRKGSSVLVEGRMHYDMRTNKKGDERMCASIVADKVEFFQFGSQKRDERKTQNTPRQKQGYSRPAQVSSQDDLPF